MRLVFRWDASKARANLRKHGISFLEARTIFGDPLLHSIPDEWHSDAEERYLSIGRSNHSRVLIVIHTEETQPGNTLIIRIISCRKATRLEQRAYEEGYE
jgi:uncharacterized protein